MRRRTLLAGLGAMIVAAAAGTVWKLRPLRKHYAPTPYDDLLTRLDDREWAARFGVAALAALPEFTLQTGAAKLRARLGKDSLQKAAFADAAAGRLLDVGGWLVPECVVLMAALAKSTS
jgi:hypothetical protein